MFSVVMTSASQICHFFCVAYDLTLCMMVMAELRDKPFSGTLILLNSFLFVRNAALCFRKAA